MITSCSSLKRVFQGPNYVDKNGERQGMWYYTAVSDPKKIESKGRFKDDRPSGKWKYFDSDQNLLRKEKYRRKKGKTFIKTKFYYPNRQVEKWGCAVIVYSPTQTHYYWIGKWKYYSATGELIAIKQFIKGNKEPEIIWQK